jgi:hypothetical protein
MTPKQIAQVKTETLAVYLRGVPLLATGVLFERGVGSCLILSSLELN